MKILTDDFYSLILTITDSDNKVKDWVEWSNSFDDILKHPRFMAYYNSEKYVIIVYDMVDIMYKIELDMNKIVA